MLVRNPHQWRHTRVARGRCWRRPLAGDPVCCEPRTRVGARLRMSDCRSDAECMQSAYSPAPACMECTRRTTTANINHGGTRAMARLMGAGWPDGCSRLSTRSSSENNQSRELEDVACQSSSFYLLIFFWSYFRATLPWMQPIPIAWRRLFDQQRRVSIAGHPQLASY